MSAEYLLPLVFAGLMALSFLMYAILDGYDLGVGMLMPLAAPAERDIMLASIGPFWDANETWLVLGVGLLLMGFPHAHNIILGQLYLPVLILMTGLILRGVSFDFRAKVPTTKQKMWDRLFFIGSTLAATTQGYMLGMFVVGFADSLWATAFCLISGLCVSAAYIFIGSSWLIMKTQDHLQQRAIAWCRRALWFLMLGIACVSVVNPLVSPQVFHKWFSLPEALLLFPIPVLCAIALLGTAYYLRRINRNPTPQALSQSPTWLPFAAALLTFILCFQGLAYSFYPYVVPFQMKIWDAAAAPESLAFVAVGVAVVFPVILFYTVLSYRVFWGKATELRYY